MDKVETRGKALLNISILLSVISLLISTYIFFIPSGVLPVLLLALFLTSMLLLWYLYEGHTWAKFTVIAFLLTTNFAGYNQIHDNNVFTDLNKKIGMIHSFFYL